MATKQKETDEERGPASDDSTAGVASGVSEPGTAIEMSAGGPLLQPEPAGALAGEEEVAPATLGASRYVHAAFFGLAILVGYLSSKIFTLIWNSLAGWPTAVRTIPQLLSYGESERESIGLLAGAVIGVITVVQIYRKEHVRRWADDVAGELAKVTWPNRETVTNGTIVVVIASMIATAYVALLDRFWGFVTNLVYGA